MQTQTTNQDLAALGNAAASTAPTGGDPCAGCPHLHAVTPRPGILDGRCCAMTSCRADHRRCLYRHLSAADAGVMTLLRGQR